MLLAALGPEPRTVSALAAELYRGIPRPLARLAELQLLAGLQKLEREGRAKQGEGGWQATGGTAPA